ncbi:hypothetical protein D9M68_864830 [compost metagenome]
MSKTDQPARCGYKATAQHPAGRNDHWECSHIACPHRHPVTAAPSDRVPPPKDQP